MHDNPFDVLGIPHNATPEQIKEAYRQKTRMYHPDRYTDPGMKRIAEENMKKINQAYDQLTGGNRQAHQHHAYGSSSYGRGERSGYGQAPWTHGGYNQNPQGQYQGSPYYRSGPGGSGCCEQLACLCCADSCCECMGGDLCTCC